MEDIMYFLELWPAFLVLGAPVILVVGVLVLCSLPGPTIKAINKTLSDKPKTEEERQKQYLDELQDFSGDEDPSEDELQDDW